jgi:hypothetical protein
MTWQVEVTDTFGGEANYCWVRRYTIAPNKNYSRPLHVVRAAKKAAGWNGLRCRTWNNGDTVELRPFRMCQVMFITWED